MGDQKVMVGVAMDGASIGNPVYVGSSGIVSMPVKYELGADTVLGDGFVDKIKRALGYLEKPLIKCRHCGQWGAVYCACRYCGAPIDPEE